MSAADNRIDDLLDKMCDANEKARTALDEHTAHLTDRNALIVKARRAGVPAIKIGQLLGVSRGMVYKVIDEAGL